MWSYINMSLRFVLYSHLLKVEDWGYEQVSGFKSGYRLVPLLDIFQWTMRVAPEYFEE